ncbi:hypothetical protein BKI52_38945 [marine bacterium AO1-C]|nr:hypothetical protein BKI52_38945 [marine bacterium AO1-C]
MNAIIIDKTGDNKVLQYQTVADARLKPNEVRMKVTATAVNYIDTLIRSGNMPPGMMPSLPFTPGVECIGVVEEVGPQINNLNVGDKVAYFGKIGAATYAEQVVTTHDRLVSIPASVNDVAAAVVPVNYATAYHMLHNMAKVTNNDVLLVHAAAGGVGTALIQLAKLVGATVIGSVGSDEKKQYILDQGADFAINYKTENLVESVNEMTEGKGVNVSFNPVASESMLTDLQVLAPFGHLVIFGFLAGLPNQPLQEALLNHFGKSLTVSYSDIYTLYNADFERLKSILSTLFEFLSLGKIAPKVYQEIPLANASTAHELLESGKVVGKLVLVP